MDGLGFGLWLGVKAGMPRIAMTKLELERDGLLPLGLGREARRLLGLRLPLCRLLPSRRTC